MYFFPSSNHDFWDDPFTPNKKSGKIFCRFFAGALDLLDQSRHTIEEKDEEPLMEVEVPVWWPRKSLGNSLDPNDVGGSAAAQNRW